MRIGKRFLSVSMLIAALGFTLSLFSEEQKPAGFVEKISGDVRWKSDKDAAETKLDPNQDIGRRLYAEERLKCGAGAVLEVYLYNKDEKIPCPSGWFPIPEVPPSYSSMKQKALEEYGRIGGRERDKNRGVFEPSDESKAIAAQFQIRWVPQVVMRSFSLVALEKTPREIWTEEITEGSTGVLVSETARTALQKFQTESGEGELILKWKDNSGQTGTLRFSLLSSAQKTEMKSDLGNWDQEREGILRHIGRASVFAKYRFFSQAAEEYEAALKLAPESRDLLRRTVDAHERTGNFARMEELKKRIL